MHLKTLFALLGLIVGVCIGEMFLYATEIAGTCLLLASFQMLIYFFEVHTHTKEKTQRDDSKKIVTIFSLPLISGLFFVCVAMGIIRVQFIQEKNNYICTSLCQVKGTVVSTPKIQNANQVFTVSPIDNTSIFFDIQVKAPLYPRYETGQNIVLFGKVHEIYSSMQHDTKKFFDYKQYLHTHDIGSEMIYPKIELQKNNVYNTSTIFRLMRIREYFISSIASHVDEPVAALSSGMLFGASSMSQELIQTFRVAGLSHIVVLSGFNISILISAVLLLLMFLPLYFRIASASFFVILFVIMVGGEASIIRATLMSYIALTALLVGRAYSASQALVLSLFIIILFSPESMVHDVSLHLSFLATAGIVYMSDSIKMRLQKIQSSVYREIIATTLPAYLVTLPYIMFTFGTFSLYALLANILVLPLVPIIMLFTFLVVVIAPISSGIASGIGYVTTLLGGCVIGIAHTIESLPYSYITISISLQVMYVLYVFFILTYFVFVRKIKNETSVTKSDEIQSGIISY